MTRNASAILLAVILTASVQSAAQPTMRLERVATSAADLDIGWIASIAAGRSGEFFVADGKAQQIVVYDSAGRRARTIGRKGEGPLEFRGLSSMAWLGDTLVVFDGRARRLTYVKPDGKLLRTTPWTAPEYPAFILGPGGSALHMLAYGRGRPEPIAGIEGGTRFVRPPKSFLRIGADGSVTTLTTVSDATTDPLSSECWGPSKGTIHWADETPTGNGPFNAFTSRGDFVSLSPGRTQISWQLQSIGPTRVGGSPYAPLAATDSVWTRETRDYIEFEKKEGKLTCNPPMPRPATIPPIRAIVADDAGGLWVDVTTPTGTRYDIYDASGKLAGSVTPPVRRVQNIPFVMRGNKLYMAEKDSDDVVSVSVYRLRR